MDMVCQRSLPRATARRNLTIHAARSSHRARESLRNRCASRARATHTRQGRIHCIAICARLSRRHSAARGAGPSAAYIGRAPAHPSLTQAKAH